MVKLAVVKAMGEAEIFPVQNHRPFGKLHLRNVMERYRVRGKTLG